MYTFDTEQSLFIQQYNYLVRNYGKTQYVLLSGSSIVGVYATALLAQTMGFRLGTKFLVKFLGSPSIEYTYAP